MWFKQPMWVAILKIGSLPSMTYLNLRKTLKPMWDKNECAGQMAGKKYNLSTTTSRGLQTNIPISNRCLGPGRHHQILRCNLWSKSSKSVSSQVIAALCPQNKQVRGQSSWAQFTQKMVMKRSVGLLQRSTWKWKSVSKLATCRPSLRPLQLSKRCYVRTNCPARVPSLWRL